MKKINYSNQEITVVWQPDLCVHSAICVHGLPSVFNSKAKPWIKIDGAESEKLIEQVKRCPSGALSYFINNQATEQLQTNNQMEKVKIATIKNGPLMLEGEVEMKNSSGQEIPAKHKIFLCRCGHSANKPFCDGSHKKIDFIAD